MNYVDNPFKSPRVLSLCTGIGGIERGLKRAIGPIRAVAYVEIESFIIENLLVGMEAGLVDAAPIWANLKTFPSQDFRGAVDGIIGGYPCQPFSTAGNRQGENDPRHLWPYIRKSIEAIGPVWCFFENVAGHLSLGYAEVYRSLRDMGYSVEPGIYTAEEVGAPHERKRLFILAIASRELQQWRRIARGWWDEFANGGKKLANCGSSGLEGYGLRECGTGQEFSLFAGSCNSLWPAGQGIYQHPWEEPRTIESPLGRYVDGNSNGFDILYVNEVYEIYTTKKIRAIKTLHELWAAIDAQKNEWTIGRLWNFLEKEILFTDLLGQIQNSRLAVQVSRLQNLSGIQESDLRDMWINKAVGGSSQGQGYLKQLHREFADAMCILSYQITLARRQEAKSGSQSEILQYLRGDYKDAWWDVPEALSAIQKVWRPVSEESSWQKQIECAYKSYRLELFGSLFGYNFREDLLRALGNSVVEQTAELAFIDLLRKHLNSSV